MKTKSRDDHLALRRCVPAVAALAFAIVAVACGGPVDETPSQPGDSTHTHGLRGDGALYSTSFESPAEIAEAFDGGSAMFDPPKPVRQVGMMFDAAPGTILEWRTVDRHGVAGPWRQVETTWREGDAHVGRAILHDSADRVELRASGPLESAYLEFSPRVTARVEGPLTRDLPPVGAEGGRDGEFRTTRQLEAPKSLVIPRKQWGARDPDKICGRKHNPYRMTIHHTASPDDDGGDPARRMRQMQAFHIDNRGWCDIGYHFVVSQSAKIFQGRSTEKRTGAHVGGENTGNIGISLIGNFEEQTVNSSQFTAATKIVNWVHESYKIPLDRQHLKGHTEWPNQATSCPGKNLKSRLKELARKSDEIGSSSPWDVKIESNILNSKDPYDQGSSKSIPDAFPGDSLQAEIVVTNDAKKPIEEVRVGYSIETPYLQPTGYTIYDDHPEHDGQSWEVDDADAASVNPDGLADSGKLLLNSLSPGESKQVRIDLDATRYSLGAVPHPDLRGWVWSIKDVYGTKKGWKDSASTNEVGNDLRARSQVDIPSRDEWRFENETAENLEGWTGSDHERLAINDKAGALAMEVGGPDPQLHSPDWTRVDADRFDELVIRLRSHDGAHPVAVYWKHTGEQFTDSRSFRFRAAGDGEFHTMVVPVGREEGWSGTITGLRIDPLDSGEAPSESDNGWYDIDGLYFRSSATGETTTERKPFSGTTVLGETEVEPRPETSTSEGEESSRASSTPRPRNRTNVRNIRVKGCSSGGGDRPAVPWALLLAVAGVLASGRRES